MILMQKGKDSQHVTNVNTDMREILKSINLENLSNSDLLKVIMQLHHDPLSSQDRTEEKCPN